MNYGLFVLMIPAAALSIFVYAAIKQWLIRRRRARTPKDPN